MARENFFYFLAPDTKKVADPAIPDLDSYK